MTSQYPVSSPSPYVTPTAIGYTDPTGALILVSAENPLPASAARAAAPTPLAGQANQSIVAGPFVPVPETPIHLQLAGDWSGQVTLQRSTDGGATRSPLTAGGMPWATFAANANEVVWQESEQGAALYLDVAVTSGTVSYRLAQ